MTEGLDRLRHACLELGPGMGRCFVAASHDDQAGVLRTFGAAPHVPGLYHHVFVTTPAPVGLIDAVLLTGLVAAVGLLAGIASERSSSRWRRSSSVLRRSPLPGFARSQIGVTVTLPQFPTPAFHRPGAGQP